MLQRSWIHEALRIDFNLIDKEKIVSICLVDEVETHKSEAEDERRNAAVCKSYHSVRRTIRSLPAVFSCLGRRPTDNSHVGKYREDVAPT